VCSETTATGVDPVPSARGSRPSSSPARRAARTALQQTLDDPFADKQRAPSRGRVPLPMPGSSLSNSISGGSGLTVPAPVFYASNGTFQGDDVHHSSNASFNRQLQLVKQRLQDQRRAQQQQQQLLQQQQLQLQQAQVLLQQRSHSPPAALSSSLGGVPPYFSSMAAFPTAAVSSLSFTSGGESGLAAPGAVEGSGGFHSSRRIHSRSAQLQLAQIAAAAANAVASSAAVPLPHPASAAPRSRHGGLSARSGGLDGPLTSRNEDLSPSSSDRGDSSSDEDSMLSAQGRVLPLTHRRRKGRGGSTAREVSPTTRGNALASQAAPAVTSFAAPATAVLTAHSPMVPTRVRPLTRPRGVTSAPAPAAAASPALSSSPSPPLPPPKPLWPLLPLSGTHFALNLSPPRPALSVAVPSYLEPLASCSDRPALVRRLRAMDEAKASRQAQFGCHIVYDSIDPNPEPMDASTRTQAMLDQWMPSSTRSAAAVGVAPSISAGASSTAPLAPYYVPVSPFDPTLVFESRFESGNLRRAILVSPPLSSSSEGEQGAAMMEYDLLLRPDVNTSTYAQWFYFAVRNTRRGMQYKFNICNLTKPDSQANEGMQPVMYSVAKARDSQQRQKHVPYHYHASHPGAGDVAAFSPFHMVPGAVGWFRAGEDVAYYRAGTSGGGGTGGGGSGGSKGAGKSKGQYILSFTVQAEADHDTLYIAYTYPYTLSMLYRQLDALEALPHAVPRVIAEQTARTAPVSSGFSGQGGLLRQRVLCRSIAGNEVPLLILTDFSSSSSQIAARQAVVLTARVHSGEANSSWMMQGIINFLLQAPPPSAAAAAGGESGLPSNASPACVASFLLRRFVFFLVPCLNVDGVVHGNYRCSLAGVDLNRCWSVADPRAHPSIHAMKRLLAHLQRKPMPSSLAPSPIENAEAGTFGLPLDLAAPCREGGALSFFSTLSSGSPEEVAACAPKEVLLYADLHGHSRASNIFMYGVSAVAGAAAADAAFPSPSSSAAAVPPSAAANAWSASRVSERVLPFLLSRRSPSFSESSCHFVVRKAKESTARVVVAREFDVRHSFTIEASFAGVCATVEAAAAAAEAAGSAQQQLPQPSPRASAPGVFLSQTASSAALSPTPSSPPVPPALLPSSRYHGFHFNTRMYEEFGAHLCLALADLLTPDRVRQACEEIERRHPPPVVVPAAANAPAAAAASSRERGEGGGGDAGALAEDSDDDEEPGDAEAALRTKGRRRGTKVRVGAAGKKKKSKRAAALAAVAAVEEEVAFQPPVSKRKKKIRARSKSVDRRSDGSGTAGASATSGALSSAESTASLHGAPLSAATSIPAAALHVKRLLERLRREAEAEEAEAAVAGEAVSDDASDFAVAVPASAIAVAAASRAGAFIEPSFPAAAVADESKVAEVTMDFAAMLLQTQGGAAAAGVSAVSVSVSASAAPTARLKGSASRVRIAASIAQLNASPSSALLGASPSARALHFDAGAAQPVRAFRTRRHGSAGATAAASAAAEEAELIATAQLTRRHRSKGRKGKKGKSKAAGMEA